MPGNIVTMRGMGVDNQSDREGVGLVRAHLGRGRHLLGGSLAIEGEDGGDARHKSD